MHASSTMCTHKVVVVRLVAIILMHNYYIIYFLSAGMSTLEYTLLSQLIMQVIAKYGSPKIDLRKGACSHSILCSIAGF